MYLTRAQQNKYLQYIQQNKGGKILNMREMRLAWTTLSSYHWETLIKCLHAVIDKSGIDLTEIERQHAPISLEDNLRHYHYGALKSLQNTIRHAIQAAIRIDSAIEEEIDRRQQLRLQKKGVNTWKQ